MYIICIYFVYHVYEIKSLNAFLMNCLIPYLHVVVKFNEIY